MLRSLTQYARYFAQGCLRPDVRRLIAAHSSIPKPVEDDLAEAVPAALELVAGYFEGAQDQLPDDGMGSYHLLNGWGASYPETTGYIIPTLLAMAERLERPDLKERALRAARWLLSIQLPDGGWPGGRVGEGRPPLVFNTGQVVRGLMAAADASLEDEFLEAAHRACQWIVDVQDADGSWHRHNFLGARRVYDTYVDAVLLHMHRRTGVGAYRTSALRNLEWALSRQAPNGWFADADNTLRHNDRPITHTMAYTIDGLLESHVHSGDEKYLQAARKAADALLDRFMEQGRLHGRYDAQWNGSEAAITTGCAQLAIVWARLNAITGEPRYAEAVERMVRWTIAVQRTGDRGPAAMRGALTGSVPLWGRYEKFACPNWAQKYFADALLCAEGRLPRY